MWAAFCLHCRIGCGCLIPCSHLPWTSSGHHHQATIRRLARTLIACQLSVTCCSQGLCRSRGTNCQGIWLFCMITLSREAYLKICCTQASWKCYCHRRNLVSHHEARKVHAYIDYKQHLLRRHACMVPRQSTHNSQVTASIAELFALVCR